MKKKQNGITLVSLVVTIVVLIILAGISINLLLGENGLITKAKEAKKQQKIAEIKEKISLELSAAETDAIIRNESLEEEQLNDIVSKYGTLQDDKDTILTKDDNYEISLKEIWYGTLSTSGSYSDKKKQIEILEKELEELNKKYKELEKINSGNSEILNDLRNQITTLEDGKKALEDSLRLEQEKNATLEKQLANLNSKYDILKQESDKYKNNPGTATADNITEGKTAWVNGELVTGTGKDLDTSYENGKTEGSKLILKSMYNSENIKKSYSGISKSVSCSKDSSPNYSSTYGSIEGYIPLMYEEDGNYYLLNTISGSLKAMGRVQHEGDEGYGSASINFYTYDSNTNTKIELIGNAYKSENDSTPWNTWGSPYNYSVALFEKTIAKDANQIYYTGNVSGFCGAFSGVSYEGGTGGGLIDTITATYIKLTI